MFVTDKSQVLGKNRSVIGLRVSINILDKWGASAKLACSILRISPSTYGSAKNKENTDWTVNLDVDVDVDVMQRISLVLNIHSTLRLIFDNPDNIYGFVGMKNNNEFLMAAHRWRSWLKAILYPFMRHSNRSILCV